MAYFPTLRSWMNGLIFFFTTLLMFVIVRFVFNIFDFTIYMAEIENQSILITFFVIVFVITPILAYGYTHYILWGKAEYPKMGWLISGDSAIEGIWMFIMLIILLSLTFFLLIGLKSPLLIFDPNQLREHGLTEAAKQADRHGTLITLLWFVGASYLYHLRAIILDRITLIVNQVIKKSPLK